MLYIGIAFCVIVIMGVVWGLCAAASGYDEDNENGILGK